MNKKHDLSSLAEAGMKIIAKLKQKTSEKIIPQDIIYTGNSKDAKSGVRNAVDRISRNNPENTLAEEKSEKEAEKAFSQFESISDRLENIKKGLFDVIKSNESDKNGLKKEDLQAELDRTVTEIENRLNSLYAAVDKNGNFVAEAISSYDEETRSKYDELSNDIKSVSENAEKTGHRIESLEGSLNEAKEKVTEIHQTTASIDKLYDSVFELKASNVENREVISELKKSQKKNMVIFIIGSCLLGLIGIVNLVILFAVYIEVL